MTTIQDLEAVYREAEQNAVDIQAKKDALQAGLLDVRAELRDANEQARQAQKALCDAQAADALLDRPDGEALAKALGLTLNRD